MGRTGYSISSDLTMIANRPINRYQYSTMTSALIASLIPENGRLNSRFEYSIFEQVEKQTGMSVGELSSRQIIVSNQPKFPIYTTQEEANENSDDNTSNPVVIEGDTYYQPNNNDSKGGIAVNGYSPLFISEENANSASTDDTSTTIVIGGNTYYRPNVNENKIPIEIDGTYPLFINENNANSASTDGTSTTIVIGGVTYYQPSSLDTSIEGDIVPFYKYQSVPAEDITTPDQYGVSVIFPVNGNQVVYFNSVGLGPTPTSTPHAFLAISSNPSFPVWSGISAYTQDAGATLSYKYIHNDFSQETEWVALVIGSPYTDVVARDNALGVFDPSTQHILVKHDQSDQQIAYFYGSIPDPLPDPNAPAGATSATEQFYDLGSTYIEISPYDIEEVDGVEKLRFTMSPGNVYHYADLGSSYYVYVPSSVNSINLTNAGALALGDNRGYKLRGTDWNIGDEFEVNTLGGELVFTLVLTDDYSLGYVGAGL